MAGKGKAKPSLDPSFTPLESPCNLFFLRRATLAVSRQYNAALKSSGLQVTQFSVLFILHVSGPLSITELANKMGLDRTSMSRNLMPLQQQGLVSVSDEGWHRTRDVAITTAGEKILKKVLPMWRKAQTAFIEHMGQADTAALIELLGRASKMGA
ncbi:MAG: MarR family winged helix-turn-helix transcriptional regulator [Gammaproteobacteria bacterium]|nr:MarR family winged helix-turn-helix transcriptional regulator [Gammaproteobacteria bacterium]MDP2348198.1 MarR family winged helix-turn-helix transcriptional regulator [Gammaproteobacteria bacterium]